MHISRILTYLQGTVKSVSSTTEVASEGCRQPEKTSADEGASPYLAGQRYSHRENKVEGIDAGLAKLLSNLNALGHDIPRPTESELTRRMAIIRSQQLAGEYMTAQSGLDALTDEFEAWHRLRFDSFIKLGHRDVSDIGGVIDNNEPKSTRRQS